MIPNDILLYSYISPLTSHHQRDFLQQQMGTDEETPAHNQTLCGETLNWRILSDSPPL